MRADRLFSRRTSRQAVLSPSTTCDPLAQHPSPESRAGQIEFHPDTRFADQKRRARERASITLRSRLLHFCLSHFPNSYIIEIHIYNQVKIEKEKSNTGRDDELRLEQRKETLFDLECQPFSLPSHLRFIFFFQRNAFDSFITEYDE